MLTIERLAGLKSQLDLTDPDWAFNVSVTGEDVRIKLRPKDAESALRSPIGIAFEIDSANNAAVAQRVEQFMRYGRPADIPSESIIRFEADLPGNLGEVIKQAGPPSLFFQKPDDEKSWRLTQRVDAVRDGRVIGTLPIEWDDRSQGPLGGSWLSGKDRSGFLELKMKMEPDQKGGGIEIQAPASDNVLPEDVVLVLRFLSLLKSGDHLRLVAPGYPEIETRISADPDGDTHVIEAGILIAESLTRIQSAAGARFPFPGAMEPEDGRMIYFLDQLLSVGRVQWYWPGYSTNILAGEVSRLLAESMLPRISMTALTYKDPVVELLGSKFSIRGEIRCEVTDMVIPNARILAKEIRDMPAGTSVLVPLAQDDRTRTMFYLDSEFDVTG
jgi:hypothetical protein